MGHAKHASLNVMGTTLLKRGALTLIVGCGGLVADPFPSTVSADAGHAEEAGAHQGVDPGKVTEESSVDSAPCPSSFEDVHYILERKCAGDGCHVAPEGVTPPKIYRNEPRRTWKSLTEFRLAGRPYLSATSRDPADSSIFCNVNFTNQPATCGAPMPYLNHPLTGRERRVLLSYAECGAPPPR